jgi:hypothetical protein
MYHAWGCVYIDDHWIDADLTFDRQLLKIFFEESWEIGEEWNGFDNRTFPAHLLLGKSPEICESLTQEEPPPEVSDETLNMLNQRLIDMRAQTN